MEALSLMSLVVVSRLVADQMQEAFDYADEPEPTEAPPRRGISALVRRGVGRIATSWRILLVD